MTTEFIDERVWTRLRDAAKAARRPAYVAVAFFSEGASRLLPLRKGSWLVVNASEATVKTGLTCPAELLRLQKRGVRVFTVQNLHAKVYVFGRQAFIGSSNASRHSASKLKEAVLRTTEAGAVEAARTFVRSLCLQELGPESLARLSKLYKPPQFPGGGGRPRRKGAPAQISLPAMRILQLGIYDAPQGSEGAAEQGRKIAEKRQKHRRSHFVDEYHTGRSAPKRGETILQVVDESDGPPLVVCPGEVLNTRKWSNGHQSRTFVYLEVPRGRRVRVNRLAKRLGRGAAKRLRRSGRVNRDFAEKIRRAMQR